jgi:TPR repeat protein
MQGHLPSLHQAAECYLEGRGVERSYVNGTRLLRAAAEKGDYKAGRRLQELLISERYSGTGF